MATIFTKIVNEKYQPILFMRWFSNCILDISGNTGHTLVVPKQEYKNIFELDEKISNHLSVVKLAKDKLIIKTKRFKYFK